MGTSPAKIDHAGALPRTTLRDRLAPTRTDASPESVLAFAIFSFKGSHPTFPSHTHLRPLSTKSQSPYLFVFRSLNLEPCRLLQNDAHSALLPLLLQGEAHAVPRSPLAVPLQQEGQKSSSSLKRLKRRSDHPKLLQGILASKPKHPRSHRFSFALRL